jgi:hypothetical protein
MQTKNNQGYIMGIQRRALALYMQTSPFYLVKESGNNGRKIGR